MVKQFVFLDEELEAIMAGKYEDFEKVHDFKWSYQGLGTYVGSAMIKRISDGQRFQINGFQDDFGTHISDYAEPLTMN